MPHAGAVQICIVIPQGDRIDVLRVVDILGQRVGVFGARNFSAFFKHLPLPVVIKVPCLVDPLPSFVRR